MQTDQPRITAAQLAELAGLDQSQISRKRSSLPAATVLREQRPGRPSACWTIEQIAEFTAERTAHLSDTECRLRAALAGDLS
ncbi:hypothetical protein D3C78_1658120 [compost metagenome]